MAFKIQRHSLKDVHGMASAAAQSKVDFATDMQNREFAFKQQSQLAQMQFEQVMKEQDFMNKLEVAGMVQEQNKEAAMMQHQLELQRIAMKDQNDFERMLAEQNLISGRITENKIARAEELQTRLDALDKAYSDGNGEISKTAYTNAKLKLISGYSVPKMDPLQAMLDSMSGGGGMGGTMEPSFDAMSMTPTPQEAEQMITDPNLAESVPVRTIQTLAEQSPYTTKTSKWPWIGDKQVPNIPVMKAKLTTAMGSPALSDDDKIVLYQLLQTGSEQAIEKAYQHLVTKMETGAVNRPSYQGQ